VARVLSFAFFIAAGLLIVSQIVATLLPQSVGPDPARGYTSHDLYESPWFIGLWVLLGLFILLEFVRSLARFIAPAEAESPPSVEELETLPGYLRVEASLPDPKLFAGVSTFAERVGDSSLAVRHHNMSRLAVPAVHLGLIGMLIGGFIGRAGWSETIEVFEKEIVPVPNTQLELRLDAFTVDYHEETRMPSLYRSDVTLFGGKDEVQTGVIEVNRPLHFEDLRFYQMDYGKSEEPRLMLVRVENGSGVPLEVPLSPNEPVTVEDAGLSLLWVREGLENSMWAIAQGDEGTSLQDPAVGDSLVYRGTLLRVNDLTETRYSGIEVVYLPGVTRLTVGILIFLVAALIYLLFPPCTIWLVREGDTLHVAPRSRLSYACRKPLNRVLEALNRAAD
jgi:hypothetical protein